MTENQSKILIVDDHDLVRAFLLALFQRYDLNVEIATNGQEAIEKWEKNNFRVILMDVDMPIMSGIKATRIIRQREKEECRNYTPIFGFSGATSVNLDHTWCDIGMDGFIAKPVIVDRILDVILPLTR